MLQHHDRTRGIRAQLETNGRSTTITITLLDVPKAHRSASFRTVLGFSYALAQKFSAQVARQGGRR